MEDDPISLSGDLSGDVRVFRDRFRASDNADVIIRRFRSGAFFSALVTIDGMTRAKSTKTSSSRAWRCRMARGRTFRPRHASAI